MKKIPLLLAGIFCISLAWGQQDLSIGVRVGTGIGKVHSKEKLGNYLEELKAETNVTSTSLTRKGDAGLNISVMGQMGVTEQISVGADLEYLNFTSQTDLKVERFEDNTGGGTSTEVTTTINSTATFNFSSLRLPFYGKYTYSMDKWRFGAFGGFAFNMYATRDISSEEDKVEKTKNTTSGNTTIDRQHQEAQGSLDGYNGVTMDLLLGLNGGYQLESGTVFLDFRLTLDPDRALYTTDDTFFSNTQNNRVYTKDGQDNISRNYGIRIDDFKRNLVQISVGYLYEL